MSASSNYGPVFIATHIDALMTERLKQALGVFKIQVATSLQRAKIVMVRPDSRVDEDGIIRLEDQTRRVDAGDHSYEAVLRRLAPRDKGVKDLGRNVGNKKVVSAAWILQSELARTPEKKEVIHPFSKVGRAFFIKVRFYTPGSAPEASSSAPTGLDFLPRPVPAPPVVAPVADGHVSAPLSDDDLYELEYGSMYDPTLGLDEWERTQRLMASPHYQEMLEYQNRLLPLHVRPPGFLLAGGTPNDYARFKSRRREVTPDWEVVRVVKRRTE